MKIGNHVVELMEEHISKDASGNKVYLIAKIEKVAEQEVFGLVRVDNIEGVGVVKVIDDDGNTVPIADETIIKGLIEVWVQAKTIQALKRQE